MNIRSEKLNNIDHERAIELLQLSTAINTSLNLSDVLQNIMEVTNKLVRSDASSLLIYNSSEKSLNFSTTTGSKAEEIKQFKLKLGQGIAGWVAEKRKPLLIPDISKDPRHFQDADDMIDYEPKSMICCPLIFQEQLLGVIQAMNCKKINFFTNEDLTILVTLSQYAVLAIHNAQNHQDIQKENIALKTELEKKFQPIYKSKTMSDIYKIAQKVASKDSTILIRGHSGTGKEMLARFIHNQSPRKNKPFICVTCSILSETLLESELFGHEKGAFTGADQQRIGKFERANSGTLFLDEIGTLSPETQLRLLRVLQEKEIERVGGNTTIPIDVRVLAATNENLEESIQNGKFREDLYYRLKVIQIDLPDLKDRPEDIMALSEYYMKLFAEQMGRNIKGINQKAFQLIKNYTWPGNVRELKNAIERCVVLGETDWIEVEDLPKEIQNNVSLNHQDEVGEEDHQTLMSAEKYHIQRILKQTNFNKSKAANILGISRNRLDRKIISLNIIF